MSMDSEKIKAGVIGLGAMGAPMARHLAAAGLLHMVWNRTAGKAQALAEATDTIVADSPAQMARACNVILTCVSADEDLSAVVGQFLPEVSAGTVVIDTSTVSRNCKAAGGTLTRSRCGFCRCAGIRRCRGRTKRQLVGYGRW